VKNRIFLLEDHSWFREALAGMLGREADLEVVGEAGSLTDARAEVSDKAGQIDLALVDLLLPDGIGTDVIRDLRATRPDVPVLVLSVARGPDLYSWVRAMGADEMISKDASTQEIFAAIRILLRG
jgi:two-component system, NarL family, response regulator DevR